jgi:hypothetical protein
LIRSLHSEHPVLFPGKLVVVHKKLFQFPAKFLTKIINTFYARPTVGVLLNCYDAVVPLLVFLGSLLALYYADGTA